MKQKLLTFRNQAKAKIPTVTIKPKLTDDEKLLMDYIEADEEPVEQENPWQGKYNRRQESRD